MVFYSAFTSRKAVIKKTTLRRRLLITLAIAHACGSAVAAEASLIEGLSLNVGMDYSAGKYGGSGPSDSRSSHSGHGSVNSGSSGSDSGNNSGQGNAKNLAASGGTFGATRTNNQGFGDIVAAATSTKISNAAARHRSATA